MTIEEIQSKLVELWKLWSKLKGAARKPDNDNTYFRLMFDAAGWSVILGDPFDPDNQFGPHSDVETCLRAAILAIKEQASLRIESFDERIARFKAIAEEAERMLAHAVPESMTEAPHRFCFCPTCRYAHSSTARPKR